MKKQLIKCALTALIFGMIFSFHTTAAESDNHIQIDETGNVTLTSDNAEQNGITALQLCLNVKTDSEADIFFEFSSENSFKITEYRYHKDSGCLNIYIADEEPIFNSSDTMEIGIVSAKDAMGNNVSVQIDVAENALKLVSHNTLTDKMVKIDSETSPIESKPSDTSIPSYAFKISKTFSSSYTVMIPDGTEDLETGQTFPVSATNVLLEHGETLQVSVESGNVWKLKSNPESQTGVCYQMGYGNEQTMIKDASATILDVVSGTTEKTVELTVLSVDKPTMAGKFSDTLTFTVNVAAQSEIPATE